MSKDPSVRLMFIVVLAIVLWSAFKVLAPFAVGFTWAAVLVATFRPFHDYLERIFRGKRWMASTLVTILVAAFVVVPIVTAAVQAVEGGIEAYNWVVASYQTGGSDLGLADQSPWVADLVARAKGLVGLANVDLHAAAVTVVKRIGVFLAAKGPALMGGVLGVGFSFLVMIVGMPVLFIHGKLLAKSIADTMPIPEADADRILNELREMTRTVFISVGLTAATQAAILGVALLALGVPHALPLTAATFFFALLPGGPAIIWIPAAIWLAYVGHPIKATLLAVWGAGVVGTIDNILRPLLAGKGSKLPVIVLFLGMFGGMLAFGLVGLFLGPIVLYLMRAFVAILRRDFYQPAGEAARIE